ncbi:MAG: DUF1294 domain-containing protein [Candidatus Didemnitutus sp.]|nr:DUF1294 domain-containing protein [Candidatus Didemnitutus sp.]
MSSLPSSSSTTEKFPLRRWSRLLLLPALLVAPGMALHQLTESIDYRWPLIGAVAISLFTFMAYAADKARAKSAEWRVPELTLHGLELIGGWPGAYLAQWVFRHKSSKFSYQLVFWLIVGLHQLVTIDYVLGWAMTKSLLGR